MTETAWELADTYDVAISFVDEDLGLAQQIAGMLHERVRGGVFIYTEQQLALLGPDGDLKLQEVFEHRARVVLLLHRERWGQKGFTVHEERALRNRIHNGGRGFLLVFRNDDTAAPTWIPAGDIWAAEQDLGVIVGALVTMVKTSGGAVGRESPSEMAFRLQAQRTLLETAERTLRAVGDKRFDDEAVRLFQRIREEVATVNATLTGDLKLAVHERAKQLTIACGDGTILLDRGRPRAGIEWQPKPLERTLFRGRVTLDGQWAGSPQAVSRTKFTFQPRPVEGDLWAWHLEGGPPASTEHLAQDLVRAATEVLFYGLPRTRRTRRIVHRGIEW
ncbi:hypothetical protein [Gaopeijia maritima]|uniref:TIR domain-containing protein n=1 Tax=Gaopeijia maritima TaxID=3119007 RepID=A0ABU9EC26_9BACT